MIHYSSTPEFLKQSFDDARAENYALGVKLVRGAYHPHELAAHRETQRLLSESGNEFFSSSPVHVFSQLSELPPVWLTKAETDVCYDSCVQTLLKAVRKDIQASKMSEAVPQIGVLFGTHNWTSSNKILDGLLHEGLATSLTFSDNKILPVINIPDEVAERVSLAQLYGMLLSMLATSCRLLIVLRALFDVSGMSDALTNYLVNRTRTSAPFVIKYVTAELYTC